MKLYLDTMSKISGNMLVAALLATGELSFEEFQKELKKLNIMQRYRPDYRQVTKGSIGGYAFELIDMGENLKDDEAEQEQKRSEHIDKTRYKTGHGRWKNSYGNMESRSHFKHKNRTRYDVQVQLEDKRDEKNHPYRFRFGRRYRNECMEKENDTGRKTPLLQEGAVSLDSSTQNLSIAKQWIEESELEEIVKEKTIEIFDWIINQRAKSDIIKEEILLNEIIEIIGAVILISKIGVQEIYVSIGADGSEKSGEEDLSCTTDPSLSPVEDESGTSVGTAILTIYRAIFEQPLNMKIKAVGVGCGEKEVGVPNMLKAVIFEEMEPICPEENVESSQPDHEENDETIGSKELGIQKIMEVQCTMEDMTGEELEYAMKKLGSHSQDVCLSSVLGKNLNPGYHLKAFCTEEELEHLIRIILSHTTAAQVYTHEVKRYSIVAKIETIETELGNARLKIETVSGNIVRQKWDHGDLVRLAEENNMNLREVQRILWRETLKK